MSLMTILNAAREMGIPPLKAVYMRLRFLMPRLKSLRQEASTVRKRTARSKLVKARVRLEVSLYIVQEELNPLEKEARELMDFINGKVDVRTHAVPITQEMIARAKAVPITQLLAENCRSGLVHCPFHEDIDPSASVKNNFLICFGGCKPKDGRKGWDSISLLMERDGLTFREAVFALLR